eukprot:TRINITY_DN19508_c0_g1_i1.p1 TRINITY_DN19508_c0_g1~~TRINITY_DN19508_c0_g1_i1.p1  ORF type:complete len:487 (-),score=85.53 TRINITY_DN19508_c0_g1_i1:183-1643(-)
MRRGSSSPANFLPGELVYLQVSDASEEARQLEGIVVAVPTGQDRAVVCLGLAGYRSREGRFLSEAEVGRADEQGTPEGAYFVAGQGIFFAGVPVAALCFPCPKSWQERLHTFPDALPGEQVLRFWERRQQSLFVDAMDTEAESSRRPAARQPAPPREAAPARRRPTTMRIDMDTDEEEEQGDFQEAVEEEGRADAGLQAMFDTLQQRFEQMDAAEVNQNPPPVAPRRPVGDNQPGNGERGSGQSIGRGAGQASNMIDPASMMNTDPSAGVQMMMLMLMQKMVDRHRQAGSRRYAFGHRIRCRCWQDAEQNESAECEVENRSEAIVTAFEDAWEEHLGARGRPWRWRDVAEYVDWKRYLSLKRCFVMMGEAGKLNRSGHLMQASAQLMQNMKALIEMSIYGDWKIAWPITHLPDPIGGRVHGAQEEELEAIMARLKIESDLDKNVLTVNRDGQSPPPAGEDAKPNGKAGKKKWWKKQWGDEAKEKAG